MYLKPDCREYASEETVRTVINKYSNFVNSPIKLNGSEINTIQVIITFYNFSFCSNFLNDFSHYGYLIQNLFQKNNMMSFTNLLPTLMINPDLYCITRLKLQYKSVLCCTFQNWLQVFGPINNINKSYATIDFI